MAFKSSITYCKHAYFINPFRAKKALAFFHLDKVKPVLKAGGYHGQA